MPPTAPPSFQYPSSPLFLFALRSPASGVDVNTDLRVDVTAWPSIVVTNTSVEVAVLIALDELVMAPYEVDVGPSV